MSNNRTRRVSEVIKSYFGRQGITRRIRQASVVGDWEVLVGSQVANVTTPVSVDADGTLRVRVESSAWMQELQLMSPTILKTLREDRRPIKRIRWMLGDGVMQEERHNRRTNFKWKT